MANKFEYREARTPRNRGKVLDHIRVKKTKEGYAVEHHYAEDGYIYHAPKTVSFGKEEVEELQAHIRKHAQIEDYVAPEPEDAVDTEAS